MLKYMTLSLVCLLRHPDLLGVTHQKHLAEKSVSNKCSLLFLSPSRWLFNKTTCTVYAFCGVLFGLSSLTNLTVLSSVCWLKVCCPNYGKTTTLYALIHYSM